MKKSDWALIVLIIIITGVVSYFVADAVIPAPNKDPQTAPTAIEITSNVVEPPESVFNSEAKNPSLMVTIGSGSQSSSSSDVSSVINNDSSEEE